LQLKNKKLDTGIFIWRNYNWFWPQQQQQQALSFPLKEIIRARLGLGET